MSLTVAALLPPLPLVRSERLPPAGVLTAFAVGCVFEVVFDVGKGHRSGELPAALFMEAMTSAGWISLPPVLRVVEFVAAFVGFASVGFEL